MAFGRTRVYSRGTDSRVCFGMSGPPSRTLPGDVALPWNAGDSGLGAHAGGPRAWGELQPVRAEANNRRGGPGREGLGWTRRSPYNLDQPTNARTNPPPQPPPRGWARESHNHVEVIEPVP